MQKSTSPSSSVTSRTFVAGWTTPQPVVHCRRKPFSLTCAQGLGPSFHHSICLRYLLTSTVREYAGAMYQDEAEEARLSFADFEGDE